MQELGVDKNSVAGDPMFIDPKKGDFSVSMKSKAYQMGWKNFSVDQFGVQKVGLKVIAKTPVIPDLKHRAIEIENVVLLYSGTVKNLTTVGELSATGMARKTGVLVINPPAQGSFTKIRLLSNDVIIKLNDETIANVTELQNYE